MKLLKDYLSNVKPRFRTLKARDKRNNYFIKFIVLFVILVISCSFLYHCSKKKITPGDIQVVPVPSLSTWENIYNVPKQYFNFGHVIEAGFDLDDDGNLEFAAFDTVDNKLVIFENIGDNAFEYQWAFQFPDSILNSKSLSITTGDMNSDGIKELIVVADIIEQSGLLIWQHSPGSNMILPEYPSAQFHPPRDNNGLIHPSTECLVRDFNNDEKDELLILYHGNNKVLMTIGSVRPMPWNAIGQDSLIIDYMDSTPSNLLGGDTLSVAGVGVGDIDHNGSKEIVIVCEGIKAPIRLYSYFNGNYKLVKSWEMKEFPINYIGSSANIPIVDFNNDGNLEAYLLSNPNPVTFSSSALVWVVELGTDLMKAFDAKNFTPIVSLDTTRLRGGVFGDGDRDGKPDIYALGIDNGTLYQIEFTSNRDSTITNKYNYVPYKIYQEKSILKTFPTNISDVLDLDGDGRNEILFIRGKRFFGIPMRSPALSALTDESGISDLECSGIPAPPSELIAKRRIVNGFVELSWKDNSEFDNQYKIRLDNGSLADIGNTTEDIRSYLDTDRSPDPSLSYVVYAVNDLGEESAPSNNAEIPSLSSIENVVEHSNKFLIGDLGGSGIGWSNFICQFGTGPAQDILYDGYLLLWSEPDPSSDGTFNIYSGKNENFVDVDGVEIKLNRNGFEHTHASSQSYYPVKFQTNDGKLRIAQITFHQPGSKWIIAWWIIKNLDTSNRRIKLALHLDADVGGEQSILDVGGWKANLKMVYQQNCESYQACGISHILNESDPDLNNIGLGTLGAAQVNVYDSFDGSDLLERSDSQANPLLIEIPTSSSADVEMTLVSDLGVVASNQFEMVFYAVAAGIDTTQLRQNMIAAKNFCSGTLLKKQTISIAQIPDTSYFLMRHDFTPKARIGYYVAGDRARITLEIFNVLGEKITSLVDEDQGPGTHSEDWNGCDSDGVSVPSGIYLYKIYKSESTPRVE